MTIDVHVVTASNLWVENEILLLDASRAAASGHASLQSVAGVSLLARRSGSEPDLASLIHACGQRLQPTMSGLPVWIFVAHGPWQPDNRITRHRGLWRSHAMRARWERPETVKSEAVAIAGAAGVRFAGVAAVDNTWLLEALELVRVDPACFLFVSHRKDLVLPEQVKRLFDVVFTGGPADSQTHIDWQALITAVCPLGDIVIRVSGGFDDPEGAIDLIGDPKHLEPFFALQA